MIIRHLISLENSLYAHPQSLIDEFNVLIKRHEGPLDIFAPDTIIYCDTDFISSVFNNWIHLIDTEYIIVPKVEKLIFHTFSFEIHKIFQKNHSVIQFTINNPSRDKSFVFAYFYTFHFFNLLVDHMPKTLFVKWQINHDILTSFASKDSDMDNPLLQEIYAYRKYFLSDLMTDIQMRYNYQKTINASLHQTEQYFYSI